MEHEPAIPDDLIEAARRGDERAWRRLVELLYPRVAGIIRNHLRRHADHEDVAQEVFLKIFLNLGRFRGEQPLEHWVARIALNACHDWLRRGKNRPAVTWTDLDPAQAAVLERTLAGETRAPESHPRLVHELVDQLIATLNPREQIVIRLLDLEQRPVHDICQLTGWGASKVKVTAMRARRKLAEQLQRLEARSRQDQ